MKREWGASVLEYTILVSLVVLMVVGAMTALGRQINHTLPAGVPAPPTASTLLTTTTCPTGTTTTTVTGSTSTTALTGC